MHRLFLNLLQNALAFTEAQGQVKITAAHENGLLHIHVIDTGIGIPAQSIPKVFDRFYRVDKSRSRASGGSGLGLPIAQAIAKAHGGAISVTSTANVGSDFAVTLPTP
jgi:two-component system phosphate regulon sensor histidine kinase PhoR